MQLDQMDYLIMEGLADLNKAPANMERAQLDTLVNDWSLYSEIVSWAATELECVAQTEETVSPVKSPEDLSDFQMSFSGLLKELGCPYNSILEQPLGTRFDTSQKKKVLLNFLLSELQAARILHIHKPKPTMKVELDESGPAKVLREIILELGLGKPPESISVAALWNNVNGKVVPLLKKTGRLDPLFEGLLSPSQWSQIDKIFGEMAADYEKRREMLLKRLDVTVQSFHWTDRLKGQKEKEIKEQFEKHRPNMSSIPSVSVSDILAARIDLPVVEKTASASVRKNTKSAVNNVVIGRVPDRGGRTDEIQPPPPEMPPWQQRQGGAPAGTSGWIQGGRGGPRGGRGGDRGGGRGRVQGGWSDSGRGGGGGGGQYQQNSRGGGDTGYSQQQYDNRGGGGGYHNQQQQYDNRGGYNQNQQQSYSSGGGGFYQHDNRSGGGGYSQDQNQYQQQQGYGGGDHQGQRDNRYDDSREHYRGGRGGRGGGRRY